MESVGRQFHYVIVNRFVEKPFLVLHHLRTVFEEDTFLRTKEAYGENRFKAILSAPGVSARRSDWVPKFLIS